jgi:hypothetical protein
VKNTFKSKGENHLAIKYFTILVSLQIAEDIQSILLPMWLIRYIYKGEKYKNRLG